MQLALPAMVRAGFDPRALLRYVERRDPVKSAERIAAMQEVLRSLPTVASTNSDAFTTAQQQARAEAARDTRPILRPSPR